MNERWDLSILYDGFDDGRYASDLAALSAAAEELTALGERAGSLDGTALCREYISVSERISDLSSRLAIYANLLACADTSDFAATSNMGRVMSILSATAAPTARIQRFIAALDGLDEFISSDPMLSEHRYLLENIKRDSKYLLSDGEETVLAKMDISGATAWSDLQSSLTSSLKVECLGEEMTLSSVRNLAYDPDPEKRRAAYEAELSAYEKIKDAIAFSLNSIKLQVISECELRGYASPLDKALHDSRLSRATLDALLGAMEEYMPVFHKYLRLKARALGYEGALPWYDLFAPMGKSEGKYTVDDAREYLLGIFSGFDSELHGLVKRAFDNAWIDFYPREGKVCGAFDCGIPSAKESRILTNFDGSFSDIVTLAHELGHAFHDSRVFKNSLLNQEYSMPVAETASTFNEVLVMETAIRGAKTREEKLSLIEGQLTDACQIICDIYSRYLFESAVFARRPEEFLGADTLSEMMLDAQRRAYGDGLDGDLLHKYMWICKSHYYSGQLSFYNYPYAFGGLFARGLYAKYKKEGAPFVDSYKEMLRRTPMMDAEDAAHLVDVDLTDKQFWRDGLRMIEEEVDLYEALLSE